jgi:hypothetical protein
MLAGASVRQQTQIHTFNRLLDNAIADAVAAYGHHRDKSVADRKSHPELRLSTGMTMAPRR